MVHHNQGGVVSEMIPKQRFGRTGHESSRIIFGSYALSNATEKEAERVLDLLLEYGINHIDTAPAYGNAELCVESLMERYRDEFFLATKSRKRTFKGAWSDLQSSLKTLRVDHIDLWQMHALINPVGWEKVMGEGGALEAFVKAQLGTESWNQRHRWSGSDSILSCR
jgi:aryl-alcohol dehydrogenase-like predicted oxidoreductase